MSSADIGGSGAAAVPMDEDTPAPCNGAEPDVPSSPDSMDWVKVDDGDGKETAVASQAEMNTAGSAAVAATQEEEQQQQENAPDDEEYTIPLATQEFQQNFDEFSFGSSDDDDNEEEEDGLEKMADVSLDTSFDMQILQSSIENSTAALDLVRGKDVIMVVGKTGVGKSTLIQGIAGKRIHTLSHMSSFSGETATKTVYAAHDALPEFEIGHAKMSKTRSLSAYLRRDDVNNREYVYLDSPGLEDTRGVEMDIATSALLSQVAKRCKSLRFVVLIHCASLLEDRGNAFRSIIKFAKRFVEDFADSKFSFIFLFSHTEEIGMNLGMEESKKRLKGEVVHIAEAAASDEDLTKVLSFINKSLKKGFHFVDILHPLDTDYNKLTFDIENRMKALDDLESASNSNLTLSSRMKLEVAVNNLLERLAVALDSSSEDITPVQDIRKTFHYLKEYIDTPSVRQAADKCEALINKHQDVLRKNIESEYTRWENPSSDFSEGNVMALKGLLQQLEQFDSNFSEDWWAQTKAGAVVELQAKIVKRALCFKSFNREFKKLQLWSDAFQSFSDHYADTSQKIKALVDETVEVISQTELSKIHLLPQEEVNLFVEKFLMLQAMCGFSEQNFPGVNFGDAFARGQTIVEDLKNTFKDWANTTSDLAETNIIDIEIDLGGVASFVLVLEAMKDVTESPALHETIHSTLKSLENDVMSIYKSCHDNLMSSDDGSGIELQRKLRWMRDTDNRFSRLQGNRWREMSPLFSAVVNKIKSSLHSTSGELSNMANVIKENGLLNGKRLGEEVSSFKECRWFDSYLPEGNAFVTNCCTAIENTIQTRFDAKSLELEQAAECLGSGDSAKSIKTLARLLPELKEIDNYVAIVKVEETQAPCKQKPVNDVASMLCSSCNKHLPESKFSKNQRQKSKNVRRCRDCVNAGRSSPQQYNASLPQNVEDVVMEDLSSSFVSRCVTYLESYTSQLERETNQHMQKWAVCIDQGDIDSLLEIAQSLEFIYADAKSLNEIQSIESLVWRHSLIIDRITSGLKTFSSLVETELNHFGGNFLLKAGIMNLLSSCAHLDLVGKELPSSSEVQHQVRNLVAVQAQLLEGEIEATSDWEKIDNEIALFEAAVVLDDYVCGEATARLNTLNRLREKKECQVDEHLKTMIDANNYKGIAEFLVPLAGSKDQIKKQRYETYRDEIVLNLNLLVDNIKRCLNQNSIALPSDEDIIKDIGQKMSILSIARENLQRFVNKQINLAVHFNELKGMITDGLKTLLDQISEYTNKKDFVRALDSDRQASVLSHYLFKYIKAPVTKRHKAISAEFERELKNVGGYVNKFRNSYFKETRDLLKSLTSLKEAKESNDTSVERLARLYEKTQKILLDEVHEYVTNVRQIEADVWCYDEVVPVLHTLQREMNGSFKPHFPSNMISECNNLLERLQQQKRDHDRSLEFGGDVHKTLELWRKELEGLKSPSIFGPVKNWKNLFRDTTASYNRLQKRLGGKCQERFETAKEALRSRDLRSVQDCIDFLDLVDKVLSSHVQVRSRIQALEKQCLTSFLSLCKEVGKLLEKKDISRFGEKFVDYRGFILHIKSIPTSKEGKKEFILVNQMLYESFVHHIHSFHAMTKTEAPEFSKIRAQVLSLRKEGDFISDHVTLFNEELKHGVAKIQDQWLDKIQDLCSKHFSNGRDFSKLKWCVELGVAPSATQKEIQRAYREKARIYHPDKNKEEDGSKFRRITEAKDELLASRHLKGQNTSQAFDEVLCGLGERLRLLAKQFMQEQRYDMAEKLLFLLPSLKEIDNLVRPKLKSKEVQESVRGIIKGHIEKMRVEIDTAWAEKRYKDLNDSISDLKAMESRFKSYPEIFSSSWNTGIVKTIESEIESLGKKAEACISSHKKAKEKMGDFKKYFLQMGSVLVELPCFKAHTRREMSNILDLCLESAWGYSYLFEFGLSLQKGDDSTDDNEKRIAQMTVAEFDHFKEVLTMCWNQETSQKPVEDVVADMKGMTRVSSKRTEKLNINQGELIESFKLYDKQYKSLIGEYIKPDADLNGLVNKTKLLASKLQPLSCDKQWTDAEKKHIPVLLAGVFSLFTVLKSGESFNRIEEAGGSSNIGEQILMKPHNIQVLTLLYMFGCGKGSQSELESQLMQIRTGEGKSMILGAAAAVLGLLGFRVRTVCYSEYLSSRDFHLFEEIFQRFGLLDSIKYSKITTFAEDSTSSKGNIRELTELLLRGEATSTEVDQISMNQDGKEDGATPKSPLRRLRSQSPTKNKKKQKISRTGAAIDSVVEEGSQIRDDSRDSSVKEEILLVDEVDVFFGAEFYGRTYNQVIEFKEPEVSALLKRIWDAHSNGHRLRLNDVKAMTDYKRLLGKMASFGYLLDNEIKLMLNQVKRVDDNPYFLDSENDRIGYKVMDSISYNVTFGYATIFAYLKEADNLKDKAAALSRLVMPISCGQFSYANISPTRIMGVSGTLQAIGEYEKKVLDGYGLKKYIFVPSVYGESNFQFDKAGEGIFFESSQSNFYQKVSAEIVAATKQKRAVIVFFRDRSKLNEFVSTSTYRQLGRHKALLKEDMSPLEKEFVINNAATAGQITLSTAVFGRGTDFFCKDESVEKNGGVHIIQTFLSEEVSEEVQIQGRTARQGKRGTYQMILLDSDLESDFGVKASAREQIPKGEWYEWLCGVREKHQKEQCVLVEENLKDATEKDSLTHNYFDSLLAGNERKSKEQFKNLYELIKKPPMPSSVIIDLALVMDVTGSMAPYGQSTVATIKSLLSGSNSLTSKLSSNFPEIEFELRVGCLGFRDIDDGSNNFTELVLNDGSHFTAHVPTAMNFITNICSSPSGGFDLAEDLIGAIHRSTSWNNVEDWTSDIKFMMLFSDAAAHGLLPKTSTPLVNGDNYSTRHPAGLTVKDAVTGLVSRDADLFFCSFNPLATERTEGDLSKHYERHPDNAAEHSVVRIPMVPKRELSNTSVVGDRGRHIIFVLDESGSMKYSWSGVVVAYNQYIAKRRQNQSDSDLVSVVQFDRTARITVQQQPISLVPTNLPYNGYGTCFHPAARLACQIARATPETHIPAVVFMSDGEAGDAPAAAHEFSLLDSHIRRSTNNHLELHVIGFGGGSHQAQLQQIARASPAGKVHASANTADLASVFVDIASTQNVSLLLESEIAKRISEAVSDKLSLEYFGS